MLTVVHPRSLGRSRGTTGQWAYADEKLETHQAAERALGARLQRLVAPEEFQAAATRLRRPFVEWIDTNLRGKHPFEWLFTPLNKNPYSSNLFLHCVWLTLITMRLQRGDTALVVVTASPGLARALRENGKRFGVPCKRIGGFNFAIDAWTDNLRGLLGMVARAFYIALRALAARAILGSAQVAALRSIDALIETWVHHGDLSADGAFRDRYFPGVMRTYQTHGLQCAYYPLLHRIPVRNVIDTYRQMRGSALLFAPFELFIKPADVLSAAMKCVAQGLKGAPLAHPQFNGVDAGPLASSATFRSAVGGLLPFLLERAPQRMAAAGVRPKWFLDWFENHPIDKAGVIGFQNIHPPCNVIAVRQYVPSPNLLSLYSTSGEVEAGVAPIDNQVCGRASLESARLYDARGRYRVVPALRYAHLHGTNLVGETQADLLVVLTHSREESLAILTCVGTSLPTLVRLFERIVIKPHPDVNPDHLRAMAEARSAALSREGKVSWSDRPVSALLASSRLVVTAGSNSSLEAVCRGIPVVLVGRHAGLDMNPLEGVAQEMWTLVYGSEQLSVAAQQWAAGRLPPQTFKALGNTIRDAFFEPVTEAAMSAFLPSPEASATAALEAGG